MNINPKLLIIAAVAILLMVAFGRNPVDEAKDRMAKEKAARGGDPLVNAIEDYNKKNGGFGGASGFNPMTSTNGGSFMSSPGQVQNGNPLATPPAAQGGEDYYPPPAIRSMPSSPGAALPPRSDKNERLPDGREVAFRGTQIFSVDDKTGKMSPLPDGVYAMMGGRLNVYVKGGRQIILSN